MTKVIVTGGAGQLGQAFSSLALKEVVALDRQQLDISKANSIRQAIQLYQPTVVINAAAYTNVEQAELEPEQAFSINEKSAALLAQICAEQGIQLIHLSTDYVFDGTLTNGEYDVNAKTNPLNEYGHAKLLGEQTVKEIMEDSHYYIIRTSWVFGQYGANFVHTMQRLAKTMDKLSIVNDQVGRPTWTRTLAEFMVYVTTENIDYGVYHLSNDNTCTWYEFSKEILKEEAIELLPVTSKEFPQKAERPKYSVLDLSKTKQTGFVIPTWQEALNAFIESLGK